MCHALLLTLICWKTSPAQLFDDMLDWASNRQYGVIRQVYQALGSYSANIKRTKKEVKVMAKKEFLGKEGNISLVLFCLLSGLVTKSLRLISKRACVLF
ncbi:hypothetical protein IFM89_017149 [Coptis chinensis]|uniref:Uncharacterized protein n=1 Tax=Coptis chinensis TaxID=261450 RepID=A0A835IB82_9MAGN|nr:hypothetical protein IFM89_017149 [Coptis chinensis]